MNQFGKLWHYISAVILALVMSLVSAGPASAVFAWENIGADPYYGPKITSRSDLVTFCNSKGHIALERLDEKLGPALNLSSDACDALLYALKCVSSDNPMPSLRHQRNWTKSVDRDYIWRECGKPAWKITSYATIHGPETYFGGMIYGNGVVRPDVVQKFRDTLYYEAVLRTENCLYFASIPWCGNLTVTTQWFICKKEKEVEVRWKTRTVIRDVPGPERTVEIIKKQYAVINFGTCITPTVPIPPTTVYVQQPSHGWAAGLSLGLGFFDYASRFSNRTSTRINNNTTYSISASNGGNTTTSSGGAGGVGQGGAGGSSTNTNDNQSSSNQTQEQTGGATSVATGDVNASSTPNIAPTFTGGATSVTTGPVTVDAQGGSSGATTVTTGDVNATSQSNPQVTGPNVTNNNTPNFSQSGAPITVDVTGGAQNVNQTGGAQTLQGAPISVTGGSQTQSGAPIQVTGGAQTLTGGAQSVEANGGNATSQGGSATGGQNTGTFTPQFTPSFTQTGGNTSVNATGGTGGGATATGQGGNSTATGNGGNANSNSSSNASAEAAAAAAAAANQSQFIKTQVPQTPTTPGQQFPPHQQGPGQQQPFPQQGSVQQPFPTQGGQQPGQHGGNQIPPLGNLITTPGAMLPGNPPQGGLITVPQQNQQHQQNGQQGQGSILFPTPAPGQPAATTQPIVYPFQKTLQAIEERKKQAVSVQKVGSKK